MPEVRRGLFGVPAARFAGPALRGVLAGVVAFVVGSLLSVGVGILVDATFSVGAGVGVALVGVVLSAVAGVIVGVLRALALGARSRRRLTQAELVEQAEHSPTQGLIQGKRSAIDNADAAVALLVSLPGFIRSAREGQDRARQFADAGWPAPFWSAVEGAFSHLVRCDETLEELTRRTVEHSAQSKASRSAREDAEGVPPFPVNAEAVTTATAGAESARRLTEIVEAAQQKPEFMAAWERRRASGANLTGFKDPAVALREITSALNLHLEMMASTVRGLGKSHRPRTT